MYSPFACSLINKCAHLQGKGEMNTFWLIGEDKGVRQKRLYQVITPAILAQEKSFMEEQTTLARASPRNQSHKSRKRTTGSNSIKESTGPDAENSTFLELIRNSESSSSLRLKNNPYKGSTGNLSGRRFSNEVQSAKNGLSVLKSRNLSKANSVDYCSEPVPSIVVDKALEDAGDARETDSLLPLQSMGFAENNAMQTGSPVETGTKELNCAIDVDSGIGSNVSGGISSVSCSRRPEGETVI